MTTTDLNLLALATTVRLAAQTVADRENATVQAVLRNELANPATKESRRQAITLALTW